MDDELPPHPATAIAETATAATARAVSRFAPRLRVFDVTIRKDLREWGGRVTDSTRALRDPSVPVRKGTVQEGEGRLHSSAGSRPGMSAPAQLLVRTSMTSGTPSMSKRWRSLFSSQNP